MTHDDVPSYTYSVLFDEQLKLHNFCPENDLLPENWKTKNMVKPGHDFSLVFH